MKLAFILFAFFIYLPFASSATPFQTSSDIGMQIDYPKYDTIKQGIDHRFHVHVINDTSAKTNTTTSCIFHLYNQTGHDINQASTAMEFETYNNLDFAITIGGTNFSTVGTYSYVIQCNSSSEIAFASGQLLVTPTGLDYNESKQSSINRASYFMFAIGLILLLSFFFYRTNEPVRYTLLLGSIIFLLITINIIFISMQDSIINPKLEGLFSSLTTISFYAYWFIGGLIILLWIYTLFNTFFYRQNMKSFQKFGGGKYG